MKKEKSKWDTTENRIKFLVNDLINNYSDPEGMLKVVIGRLVNEFQLMKTEINPKKQSDEVI